tara:strand:- start:4838 stop:5068 length:231 start_codon:yes stop_codon:yes gene_type:complete
MVELVKLFIEKPIIAVPTILSIVSLYTLLGMFSLQSAIAGLESNTRSQVLTEQRVFEMAEQLGRIETHLELLIESE